MAKTQVLSPMIVDPNKVSQSVANLKAAIGKVNEFKSIADKFKETSGVDLTQVSDPTSFVAQKMITDAKSRIAKGKEGAVPVIGDPKNENTCLAGVCTIAADAGVSFSKLKGNAVTGLATDKKGRKIPQYNPLFASQLEKTGYYEIPEGESPMPGDLVQYFEPQGDMGELTPRHMEFILEDKGGGKYSTFNNYGLFNSGAGESDVTDVRGTNKTDPGRSSTLNRFYRLKPEVAKEAVGEEGIKAISQANELSKQLGSMIESGMPDEGRAVFGTILNGLRSQQSKEKVLKNALAIAKDKDLVRSVIEEVYK